MKGTSILKAGRIVVAILLSAELSGCVSVSTTRTKAAAPGSDGSLEVAVYDTPAQARAGVLSDPRMSLEVGRFEKGREVLLQTAAGSTWSFDSLPPTQYRLRLKAAPKEDGSGPAIPPTITDKSIQVAAGETVRTQVILKKFPTTAVVIGGVVVVGAVAGIAYAVTAHELDGLKNIHFSRAPAKKSVRSRR
jgi:hypothetical protein